MQWVSVTPVYPAMPQNVASYPDVWQDPFCISPPSVHMPTVFGLMYDYVCSKHKAYAKATRTTAEGAEGDPGIGQPTRRCSSSRPPHLFASQNLHMFKSRFTMPSDIINQAPDW